MATHVITLQEFRDRFDLQTEQALAEEIGVAQSTMHRWLKRGDVFVEMEGARWVSVFVEKVLRERPSAKRIA